jgi:hypothetical protein
MKYVRYVLLLTFVLFCSCDKQDLSAPPDDNPLVTQGVLKLSIDMTNAPLEVVSLIGSLYNDEGDFITFDFEIEGSSATAFVEDIKAGIWTLTVDALDENGDIIYSGTILVTVYPGVVTPVSIHLNSATGSLDITVTWGDGDDQFEENDQQSEAAPLYEYNYYHNLYVFSNDDDWYSMTISADSLSIICIFDHANGDINMDLVDANGIILATSQSTTDDEQISHIVDELGTYYIHVYLSSGTSNTYTFWWDDIWAQRD